MLQEEKELSVDKNEAELSEEVASVVSGRMFKPNTDIVETDGELILYMDMPGVRKEDINVKLEKNVLVVNGDLIGKSYQDLKPLYAEYNLGGFGRHFQLSNEIDQSKISARMEDGVLSLTLPKIPEKQPKKIEIS